MNTRSAVKNAIIKFVFVLSATQLLFPAAIEDIKPIAGMNIKTIEDATHYIRYCLNRRIIGKSSGNSSRSVYSAQVCPLVQYLNELRGKSFTKENEEILSLLFEAGKNSGTCLSHFNKNECSLIAQYDDFYDWTTKNYSHRHILFDAPLESIPFLLNRGFFSLEALKAQISYSHLNKNVFRAIILHPDFKITDDKILLALLNAGTAGKLLKANEIREKTSLLALCMRHSFTVKLLNTCKCLDEILTYLIENSDQEVLELFDYLVGQGLEIPIQGKAMVTALKKKNFSALEILIKAFPKSAYGNLMRESLIIKDVAGINFLLQHGINMAEEGKNFLHEACILGDLDHVLHLIELGVDVNAISQEGKTPLDYAKHYLKKELVEALELLKSYQKLRFHDLVVRNDLVKVKLLIAAGESCNKKSSRYGGKTALALAVEHELNDMIDLLLAHKADLSIADNEGKTPLHLAAKKGSYNIVMKLLENEAHIESVDTQGATPLLYACTSNSNCVGLLYMQGASLDVFDKKGKRALHYACEAGASDVVDFLIESFQDDAARDNEFKTSDLEGMNALHYAALSGSLATVEKVLTGITLSSQDKRGRTALHYAAESGSESMIKYLCDTETENAQDSSGLTPLHIASNKGHIKFMQALMKLNGPLDTTDAKGRLPIHHAAASGHSACVECLIKSAISTRKKEFTQRMIDTPDIEGQTALHHAVIGSHRVVVQQLIAAGATLDSQDNRGRTSLHYAVKNKDFELTSSLLNGGSSSYIPDYTGETPASMSVMEGCEKIAPLFSEKTISADAHIVSPADAVGHAQLKAMQAYQACDGDTPLHMALSLGNGMLIKALINSKQDINQPNSLHIYPIHLAVKSQNSSTVRELLAAEAQVDVCDKEGNTPLHYAAKYPNIAIVRTLLAQKASPTIKNQKNLTPFQVASLAKNKEIALILLGLHDKVLES
jgi:ankyrin repeat protein